MADAMQCDRCREFQSDGIISSGLRRVRVRRYRFRSKGRGVKEAWTGNRPDWKAIDLCAACSRDLDAFLDGWKVVDHAA